MPTRRASHRRANDRRTFRPALIALACMPALAGAQSTSPAPTGTEARLDTVIVTGTRAKDRTLLESASPVDVLFQDDLRRAAGPDGNLASALQTLLPSFNFPRQSNSSGADHVRAAQLRGLSPDQVLVLVNGKRRHSSAIVNLDSKLGKGTNPVDFNSIPVNAIKRIEVLRDGAGAQYGSDAIAGVINIILDNASSGGEIETTLGANRTQFEPTDQRIVDGQTAELRAKHGWSFDNGGSIRAGVEAKKRNSTNRSGFDDVATQIDFGFFDDTPDNRALDGRRNYRPGEPELKDFNLWANAGLTLSGGQDLYGFATYNHRDSVGAAFYRYPDTAQNVKSIYPNGFRPETTGINQDLQVVGGVRGSLGEAWSYDTSLTYGRNDFDYGVRRSVNASLGAASPTSFDLAEFASDQLTANVDLSHDIAIPGLAKPALLAFGGEYRREGFKTRAGDAASYAIGPVTTSPSGAQAGPGLQPSDAVDLSRNVYGIYGDLSADLTPTVFANAAVRYDHYGDAGGSTTGKLAGRWALAPEFALRAAASTNFRAPSLAQSGFSFSVTDRGDGGALTQVRTLPVNDPLAQSLGAKDLKAEKSRNFSIGLSSQPVPGLTLTLDAYRIDIDDRITLSERQSSGADSVNFFTNAVDTRTRGVDLVASWLQPVLGGELRSTLASSWTNTSIREVSSDALIGLETRNTLTDAAPKNRHIITFDWQGADLGVLARFTRHGETTRVFDFGGGFVPKQTYDAVWQVDLEGEWKLTKQWRLAVGGVNITDRYPERSSSDISYFNNLPYDVLSPIGFSGAYYYARLKYEY
jgi:iron complex outermembrane receptor protein